MSVSLNKRNKQPFELKWLKIILATYILLCIIIAGLNYGYAQHALPQTARIFEWIWHFYENWIKTIFILVSSILTYRLISKTKQSPMRKGNLIGLSVTALLMHILLPLLFHNPELYLFSMPLPWNSSPMQLLVPGSSLLVTKLASWGLAGVQIVLIYHFFLTAIVLIGTFLYGRRWQCSTLCMFNGFAAEVFAPAFPLIGKSNAPKTWIIRLLSFLRWVFLLIALFFTVSWIAVLAKIVTFPPALEHLFNQWEVNKYLLTELLLMMLFWIAFIGRGYCFYCPLGTVLSFVSKLGRQRILTDLTKCIQCGKCNQSCPMLIDVMKHARNKLPVIETRCVGCGHCIDACPTKTLSYSTAFKDKLLFSKGTVPKENRMGEKNV